MFCPKCGKRMNYVMHFEKDKSLQFYRCKCFFRTNYKILNLNNLNSNKK